MAAGVRSCTGADLDAMQRTVFAIPPLKEIAMVDPDGGTRCTHFGTLYGRRIATSSERLAGSNYLIEVVEVADRDRRVRIRRQTAGDYDTPADAFARGIVCASGLHPWRTARRPRPHVHGERRRAWREWQPPGRRGVAAPDGEVELEQVRLRRGDGGAAECDRRRHPATWSGSGCSRKSQSGIVLIGFTLLLPRPQRDNPIAELERALEAGEFVPYYQPIVDIRSGQLRGAEVLVRWKKPDGSLVLPGAFVPLAESSGLILPMTRRMMRQVCSELGPAIGMRPGLKIGFNMAARLFRDEFDRQGSPQCVRWLADRSVSGRAGADRA